MTQRAAIWTIACTLVACALALSLSVRALSTAAARADNAEVRLIRVSHDGQRILALRAQSQTVAAGQQPRQDIYQRVNQALAAAGLTQARVQSANPAGDQALDAGQGGGAARRVQSARIVIEPLTLDELGSLLNRWRQDQAVWTITGIDCTHAARASTDAYRITLTVSAVYIPDPANPARTP